MTARGDVSEAEASLTSLRRRGGGEERRGEEEEEDQTQTNRPTLRHTHTHTHTHTYTHTEQTYAEENGLLTLFRICLIVFILYLFCTEWRRPWEASANVDEWKRASGRVGGLRGVGLVGRLLGRLGGVCVKGE